ncbi:LOW QUALITY PROTEIN: protein phosphatase 1 regulatory inhibitor subunit 16B-like [Amphiura filiformis]|uniref:LOW QUALITY PROTEIN: protein phosphatase 1 regulatory inhibitor subunit 16B-like n=1 Tax=Amphiura filiformis TaxID=82378 RepID=UPI003B21A05F
MADHVELVTEMPLLEKMSVQERLKHARKRRSQQLKRYAQYEKDQSKKLKKGLSTKSSDGRKKRRIQFAMNIQLLEAAARGDLDEVRKLLENGVDPNIGNEDGLTALHQCCIDNNEAMMKVLVEHGADVNVTDRELWTPLHAASTCGHVNLAQYLISKGAALLAINSDGNMPYDICEDEVTLDYIESQMATQGITQDQIDELREKSPNLMLQDMERLHENGEDLEGKDDIGATPLHIAAANGYDRVALFLLEHHVDVHVRDKDGWQPIHAAACWAHGDMIQLLVQHGADLDSKTDNAETPLTICEDDDLKGLMNQLRAEIQTRTRPTLVRRSSSRSKRGSSIRRSSKREKGEMRKKDAQGEAAFYLKQGMQQEDETNGDMPSTNIDDIAINTSEPSSPTTTTPAIDLPGEDDSAETDLVVPTMPSIAEQPEGLEHPPIAGGEVHQNGGVDDTCCTGMNRKLKSILKRRENSDASLDMSVKKGRKSKRDSREPELSAEEKERIREEKEKERLRVKEQKEQEKKQHQEEKHRLKVERQSRKEQKRIEKEEAKRKAKERKDTIKKEQAAVKRNSAEDPAEQYYQEKMAGKETLAELKRQRSSHGRMSRTRSDASDMAEEDEEPGSHITPRKTSMDMLNDLGTGSMKRNSPSIKKKILINRPSSGSYYLNEGAKHEGEVNGVGDQSSLATEEPVVGAEDPPKKKFSSVGSDAVFSSSENSRCCIIM